MAIRHWWSWRQAHSAPGLGMGRGERPDDAASLRRAGQAAKNAGDAKQEARVRRLLTQRAKFAARLGFSSPTAYEDWLSRGSPKDELPAAVRTTRKTRLKSPCQLCRPCHRSIPSSRHHRGMTR